MARKDVLKGLIGEGGNVTRSPDYMFEDTAVYSVPTRVGRGAIGAVSRSIADLKSRAVIEIDPALIEAGGLSDRLETDEESDRSLRDSIAAHGQQVPVLVRPHPESDGRYQIVYGRRRVRAMRDLGLPVKALVRDLDDVELVVAQGQENSARRDLSFIEKVNFAWQMETAGYGRKVICDALAIDKTVVSRMLSVAERVPAEAIGLIGAAPAVGRDRWLRLAEMLETSGTSGEELIIMLSLLSASLRSDERFQAAWDYLDRLCHPPKSAPLPVARNVLQANDGRAFGSVRSDGRNCTVSLDIDKTEGFEAWLVRSLPDLFDNWRARESAPAKTATR